MKQEIAAQLVLAENIGNFSGYGIKNTVKRIEMYYGKDYGISITSEEGIGTRVLIKIPAVYENKDSGKLDFNSN